MDIQLVAFLATLLGVVTRTALPYIRKVTVEHESLEWNHGYTLAALCTLVLCVIVTAVVFPGLEITETATLQVFLIAFAYGLGFDALIIEIGEWAAAAQPSKGS